MKILWSWLNDHLSVTHSIDGIVDALTHSGTETEIAPAYTWTKGFQVARVLSTTAHPNAENLQVCDVDLGQGNIASIVCGAKNVRAGLITLVALPGCFLPGSATPLAACVLRGVPSNGMLCSARELSMEDIWGDEDGLVELPESCVIGTPLRNFLPQDDVLLHLNATPNRGDLFSHRGVARELIALGLGIPKIQTISKSISETVARGLSGEVERNYSEALSYPALAQKLILNTPGCLLFQLCRIDGVNQQGTPAWMKRRLIEVSTKCHGPCVDITNYASEDNGQPLHAFDADEIQGDICIRSSTVGESFQALDGENYALPAGSVVVSDEAGILSLAGIMGGMRGRCQSHTRNILLESACFDPTLIARAGRLTRLNSASRGRFERGVDPDFSKTALQYAAHAVVEQTGGSITGWSEMDKRLKRSSIIFNSKDIYTRCGVDLPLKTIVSRLEQWGAHIGYSEPNVENNKVIDMPDSEINISNESAIMKVTPPSWRWDWQDSWDCVNESLRGQGYTEIPATPLQGQTLFSSQKDTGHTLPALDYALMWSLRDFWIAQGFYEVVTWSFISSAMAKPFFQGTEAEWNDLQLNNPISKECSVLRPSILPSLLAIASHHQKYGLSFQPIFEIGPRFFGLLPSDQRESLSVLWPVKKSDAWIPENPNASKEWCFYDIKSMIDRCVRSVGIEHTSWVRSSIPWYHPGQSADLIQSTPDGDIVLATMGKLHPRLNVSAFGAELHLNAWKKLEKEAFYSIPLLQPVGKDLSFYIPDACLVGSVLQRIKALPLAELDHVMLIDVFQDKRSDAKDVEKSIDIVRMEKVSTQNTKDTENGNTGDRSFATHKFIDQEGLTGLKKFEKSKEQKVPVESSLDMRLDALPSAAQRSITIRCIFQPTGSPFSSETLHGLMHTVAQCTQEYGWILRGNLDEINPK